MPQKKKIPTKKIAKPGAKQILELKIAKKDSDFQIDHSSFIKKNELPFLMVYSIG